LFLLKKLIQKNDKAKGGVKMLAAKGVCFVVRLAVLGLPLLCSAEYWR
jgi:hypothetical protein